MNKVIIISGGAEGLGQALAEKLNKNNRVVILARDEKKAKQAAKQLKCDYKLCDVSVYSQDEKAVLEVIKTYKKIDVVVNNAGLWIEGDLEKNDPNRIKEVINSNTLGTIFLTRAVLPHFKKRKSGTIINVISRAGVNLKPERSVYQASKWAITGFTKSLEIELAPFNIRVCGIYPGKINTNLFKNARVKKNLSDSLKTGEVANAVEFIINTSENVRIPHLEIVSMKNF